MENKKTIAISLFRVSADSKYLDMIFSCPVEYFFDSLTLEVRFWDPSVKQMRSSFFDLSTALFDTDPESPGCTINQKHWTVRLPLSKIGIEIPAIYKATIKAQLLNLDDSESGDCPEKLPDELCDHMICSDVNYAYRCMLDDLLGLDDLYNSGADRCLGISDELIREYLLIYGHQAALATGDDEVAERFFRLIGNCFQLCDTGACGCGCEKPKPIIHKHNCNCGK